MNILLRSTPRRLLAASAALLFVAAACGSDDTTTASTTSGPGDASSTTLSSTTDSSAGTSASSSATTASTSTTASGPTTTGLAGEPFEGFFQDGDTVGVVGVAHDDQLNIREGPGTDQAILAAAAPTAGDLVATGEARILSRSIWYEVTLDGVTGWGSASYMAYLAGTDDATAEYLASQERPEAETMAELGSIVADWFASDDPKSDIVQSVAPTVGDLGEVTVDVIGIGDDAVFGFRLHIFGEETDGGEGFALRTIERTLLCGRGLSGEICV